VSHAQVAVSTEGAIHSQAQGHRQSYTGLLSRTAARFDKDFFVCLLWLMYRLLLCVRVCNYTPSQDFVRLGASLYELSMQY